MAPNSAPILAARVLLERGLADDVIVGHVGRTWALDDRACVAALAAARLLVQQESAARRRLLDGPGHERVFAGPVEPLFPAHFRPCHGPPTG